MIEGPDFIGVNRWNSSYGANIIEEGCSTISCGYIARGNSCEWFIEIAEIRSGLIFLEWLLEQI